MIRSVSPNGELLLKWSITACVCVESLSKENISAYKCISPTLVFEFLILIFRYIFSFLFSIWLF
jgi:hypothetical protein